MSGNRPRTIRWEQGFHKQTRAIVGNDRLVDEMIEAIDFVLCTLPMSGAYIGGPRDVWAMQVAIPGTNRAVAIYYTFDARFVYLHRALQCIADD